MIDKEYLLSTIRDIPDFPKPGIVFKDITTLLNNAQAFTMLMEHLENRYKEYNLDFIAGIESRGFIFGAALATRLGIGFVPVRKKGKLPYTTVDEKYALEYGVDEIEIHIDAFRDKKDARVLLIDDLIATGGTAEAAAKLIKKVGANLLEACFIINLAFLHGEEKIKQHTNFYSVLEIA
ncbi:adenine phosphoribosyltransferase [Nitratiruptor sp. YY08-26]|uniref:adenine phosphoribosyltransferase n=1 Tax=unclassified Nitratiruptor TaxID=2624044 RepID=UPI00191628AB|nr:MULTISPECIES: adenine phosphoribosyltransferase [unclassified Nitratiruptor]BCD62023.1 adenine phosphoribosyltransferase [Nitratiruptor sp. YY08-13]BCD65959.1 adenine phosphoribosyltransferase [Nitratiruptor sp. YY08-26]